MTLYYIQTEDVFLGLDLAMGFHGRYLSWKGVGNLLDRNDNGRGFQTDLIEGWPHSAVMGAPYCWDACTPTQGGGGDNYQGGSKVETYFHGDSTASALVRPKDYCKGVGGPYRNDYVLSKWPETFWTVYVSYDIIDDTIFFTAEWTNVDSRPRYLRHVRDCMYVSPRFFHESFDEGKRDWNSWKSQTINASHLRIASDKACVLMEYRRLETVFPSRFNVNTKLNHFCGGSSEKMETDPSKVYFIMLENDSVTKGWINPGEKVKIKSSVTLSDYHSRSVFLMK